MRDAGGAASTNIFAAGEIMAGNVLRRGYVAGVGMTIGTVFGRIAGAGGRAACRPLSSMRARRARHDGVQRLPLLRAGTARCSPRWSGA